jgi:hypothetical protein
MLSEDQWIAAMTLQLRLHVGGVAHRRTARSRNDFAHCTHPALSLVLAAPAVTVENGYQQQSAADRRSTRKHCRDVLLLRDGRPMGEDLIEGLLAGNAQGMGRRNADMTSPDSHVMASTAASFAPSPSMPRPMGEK